MADGVINIGPALSTSRDWDRERRRRQAEILMGGGTPRTGHWSDGLADAGKQLVGSYQLKKEDERQKELAAKNNEALSALLKGGSAKPWVNPDTGQTSDASAGGYEGMMASLANYGDTDVAKTLLPQLLMGDLNRKEADRTWKARFDAENNAPTPDQRNYQFARENGFNGTFVDWLNTGGDSKDPSSVQEWKFFNNLPPTQQAAYLTMKRAVPFVDLGDRKVMPNPAQPGATMAEMPVGLPPERKVQDNQVITLPAVSGGQPTGAPPPQVGPQQAGISGAAPAVPQQTTPGGVSTVSLPKTPEQAEQEKLAADVKGRASDVVLQDLDRAISMIDNSSWYSPVSGMGAETFAGIGGTDAADMKSLLEGVGANVGFDRLQQMRDSSPTGGALGAISEGERTALQSVLGSLSQSQSPEQLRFNLNRLKETYLDIVHGKGNRPNNQANPNIREASSPAPQPNGAKVDPQDWLRNNPPPPAFR